MKILHGDHVHEVEIRYHRDVDVHDLVIDGFIFPVENLGTIQAMDVPQMVILRSAAALACTGQLQAQLT